MDEKGTKCGQWTEGNCVAVFGSDSDVNSPFASRSKANAIHFTLDYAVQASTVINHKFLANYKLLSIANCYCRSDGVERGWGESWMRCFWDAALRKWENAFHHRNEIKTGMNSLNFWLAIPSRVSLNFRLLFFSILSTLEKLHHSIGCCELHRSLLLGSLLACETIKFSSSQCFGLQMKVFSHHYMLQASAPDGATSPPHVDGEFREVFI